MAALSVEDYKRFKDGLKQQYEILLTEKEAKLKEVEESKRVLYDSICHKIAEYEIACIVYGVVSEQEKKLSDEIAKLIQQYDGRKFDEKIKALEQEIEQIRKKI